MKGRRMKTEVIEGVEVTVIENHTDMLQTIEVHKISQCTVPLIFNVKCNDKTVTTTSGFS